MRVPDRRRDLRCVACANCNWRPTEDRDRAASLKSFSSSVSFEAWLRLKCTLWKRSCSWRLLLLRIPWSGLLWKHRRRVSSSKLRDHFLSCAPWNPRSGEGPGSHDHVEDLANLSHLALLDRRQTPAFSFPSASKILRLSMSSL